ncbi:MAG TPA: hypothetical protein VIX13_04985 [Candidatus Eisenbacteria bacterium]
MGSHPRATLKRAARALLPWILVAITLFIAWSSDARAGAWGRSRGEAYAKASVSYLKAEVMFDDSGKLRPPFDPALYDRPRYVERGSALYVEYGVFDALTLLGSLPLKIVEQDADGLAGAGDLHGEAFGFADVHLGARLPLHRGRWAAAIEPDLKIPLRGTPDVVSTEPTLSTGFTDFGAALCLGTSLPRVHGYGQGSIGYRIRGGRTAEEEYWDLEAGLEPTRVLRARFRYDGVHSERRFGGAPGADAPVPGVGEQDYQRIAPTLAIALGGSNEFSVTWRRVIDGRSTLRSSEWELGFSFLGKVVPAPGL